MPKYTGGIEKYSLSDEAKAKAGGPNPKRPELVTDCVEAAREDKLAPFNVSEGSVVLVITSGS